MNLISFVTKFPDEASCRKYLRLKREEEGIRCRRCGSSKHFWLEKIEKWQCRNCGSRVNLKADTIMQKSKLPVRYWFMAIHLLTSTKKSFSALELQYQLGHKRYEPIWYMLIKIRRSMGKRDARYKLKGEIEVDDAFFETVNLLPRLKKDDDLNKANEIRKRGRGSQKQMKVLVMVESSPNPKNKNKHKPSRKLGYIKMIVTEELDSKSINQEVKKYIDANSRIITDGWKGYNNLSNVVDNHMQMVVPPKEAGKKLPWVHKVISNAKRLFLGIYHSIGKEFLQNYLDEFCYKLNRRNNRDNLFDRMIVAGIKDF